MKRAILGSRWLWKQQNSNDLGHYRKVNLTLTESNCTRVLTTSTGVRAPWVIEQQIPPAAAPLR